MTQENAAPLIGFVQTSTKRSFVLRHSRASMWSHQWPTDRVGDIFVTESPGSIEGSVFAYWIGAKSVHSPQVQAWIQQHIDDHDVVRIYYVQTLPDEVHSSLEKGLAALKATEAVTGADHHKAEAIAWADAYLTNVGLTSYTDLVKAHSWKPIAEAPKDRYLLGRDPGLKRPFVMIWNVRDQQFEASHGMGDEIPTEYMELPA